MALWAPFLIRTNDREYLKYVDRLYAAIASQLKGFFYKDGGCIIGIQLENELQHSAAPWAIRYPDQPIDYTVADYDVQNTKFGVSVQEQDIQSPEAGNQHMKTLKEIALSYGMEVPLYTATGVGKCCDHSPRSYSCNGGLYLSDMGGYRYVSILFIQRYSRYSRLLSGTI